MGTFFIIYIIYNILINYTQFEYLFCFPLTILFPSIFFYTPLITHSNCIQGWNENNDVVDVVRYLLKLGTATRIALWGRQLGAATALSYASRDPRVACLILDTPYSSLDDQMDMVVKTAQREGMSVPSIVLKAATTMLKRSVRKKIAHKFDPNKLAPKTFAPKCKCPALFGGDTNDGVVPPSMVEKVYIKYGKKKTLKERMEYTIQEGSGHFGIRPEEWSLKVYHYLLEHLYRSEDDGNTKSTKKKKKSKKNKTNNDDDDSLSESKGKKPVSVSADVFAQSAWPPEWVVNVNTRLEMNRNQNTQAAAAEKKNLANNNNNNKKSSGETKTSSEDVSVDMMEVVNEDAEMIEAMKGLNSL